MVATCACGKELKLFRVFDVSGCKLSALGHPLTFSARRLFFAHAAEGVKKPSAKADFYFVIFRFCDVILIDAGAILSCGRNVNRWVV